MPAIAGSDDLHAWLLRGLVQAGAPDRTLGGTIPPTGAVNAENARLNRGVEGVLVVFPGVEAGEEGVFALLVVRDAVGSRVAVRCPDALFSHDYPASPPEPVAARILQDVRAHAAAFSDWRRKGGVVGYSERLG